MKKSIYKFRKLFILPLLAAGIILSACNKDDDEDMQQMGSAQDKNIVQVAASDSQFSILVEAVQKAGLVSALEGEGPFTVFAPTNDAFNDLFAALGVNGVDDLSAETLTPILLYHVLGVEAKSSSLSDGYVETLNTSGPDNNSVNMLIELTKGVMLNGNTSVVIADVEASNGVIHAINKVLLPPSVVDLAIGNSNFSTLVAAVVKADLVDALSATGPFTVFAPTNAAFDKLFMDLGVTSLDELTAEALSPILLYHVVSGNVRSSQVSSGTVPSLNGANITINVNSMGVMLNGTSNVVAVDVQGTNGVIHAIDQVILPPQ